MLAPMMRDEFWDYSGQQEAETFSVATLNQTLSKQSLHVHKEVRNTNSEVSAYQMMITNLFFSLINSSILIHIGNLF
jgi:hypothetical protein